MAADEGWLSTDGPSRDLEAAWGPGAVPPPPGTASPDALETPSAVVPTSSQAPRAPFADVPLPLAVDAVLPPVAVVAASQSRRRVAMVLVGVVAIVAAAGAVRALTGPDPGRELVAASAEETNGEAPAPLTDNARAFLERWNAGPSTTMPLGEAGVPMHERPTTTTMATTTLPPRTTVPRKSEFTTKTTLRRTPPTTTAPAIAADDPRLRGAEEAAVAFVDAMEARDCEAVWALFSANTIAFFESMDEQEGEQSVKDSFCASLRSEEIPDITVRPPAKPYKDGAMIDMEAEGETQELYLVLEGDRWLVDLLGPMSSDDDYSYDETDEPYDEQYDEEYNEY